MRDIQLPLRLHREYTGYLYGALPLVVLASVGLTGWIDEHYVELFAVTERRNPDWLAVDFIDAQAYGDVLETARVHRGDLGRQALSEIAHDALAAGSYLIAFIDVQEVDGRARPFAHEVLIFGHRSECSSFQILGFDADQRFTTMELSAERLDRSFVSALEMMSPTGSASHVQWPLLMLGPGRSEYQYSPERFLERLRRHRNSESGNFEGQVSKGSWWLDDSRPRFAAPSAVGLDVYDVLSERLSGGSPGSEVINSVQYRALHVMAEHKRALKRRIEVAIGDGPDVPTHRAVERANFAASSIENLRYQALFSHLRGRASFPWNGYADILRAARQAELDALDAALGSLAAT